MKKNILLIFLIYLSIIFSFNLSFARTGRGSRYIYKACVSNLKTIQGAIELYIMEHENGYINNVDTLVKNNYLKANIKCYKGGEYIFTQQINKNNLNDFFKIVKCPFHGFYDEQNNYFDSQKRTLDEYLSKRKTFINISFIVLFLLLAWQFHIFFKKFNISFK